MKKFSLWGMLVAVATMICGCGDDTLNSSEAESSSSEVLISSSEETIPASSSLPVCLAEVPECGYTPPSSSSANPALDSVVNTDTTKVSYSLKAFKGPFTNPHKGFCVTIEGTWAFSEEWDYAPTGAKNNKAWDVVSHGCGYQRWNKLNPAKGVYDWTDFEKLLNAHAEHGLGYGLRVFPYASPMGRKNKYTVESDYDWTPSFVYEAGAKKDYAKMTDGGVEYTLAVPRWDDPIYIHAAKDFAAALAAKYDGDPRLEYIDVRAFGNWGEWHISHFDGSQMPSDSVQIDMLEYYASLFKKTLLVLPSDGKGEPFERAMELGIAKRDDGLIGTPWREDSLAIAYKAGLPTIGENISTYEIMLTYDNVIPGGYLKWTVDRWKEVVYKSHMTYYVLDQDNYAGYQFYLDNKEDADSLSKVLGYNFSISKAELVVVGNASDVAAGSDASGDVAGGSTTLNITVKNTGLAPCFFDVYIVAELVDSAGVVLEQLGKTVYIPKGTFKDEDVKEFSFTNKIAGGVADVAAQPGVTVALSIYENEEAYKSGKNPTVKFDNDGIMENNKLLLKQ
ncbi:hypothetical protein [Fibrobacter sp. UWEL]|uniref:hypothetical protein n=1 Tax=Fibrobacter sp. UWEL TaxID=1896209 RepID=UPI0009177455|nr:hypothetical protein [Fibrobacter sp. UWEL]SHL36467.1 hypothetical protein SAMN05720468_1245 [Fibrobacter sp. UWEL]